MGTKKKSSKRKVTASVVEAAEPAIKFTKKSPKSKHAETSTAKAIAVKPDVVSDDSEDDFFCHGSTAQPQTLQTSSGDDKISGDHKVWVGDLPWNVSEETVK